MLCYQEFSSVDFLYSFPPLRILVNKVFPWICLPENEACVQLIALMSRKAAKRKSISRMASVEADAETLEML